MSEVTVLEVDGPEPVPYVPTLLDAELAPDDVAAWAASVTPGSAVAKPLAVLDPRRLSVQGRVDALAAMERQLAWWQARQHRLLAVMAADPAVKTPFGELDKEWVREDVACALRLSAGTAAYRLGLATELTRLPATLDLLERGEIRTHHARHLAEAIVGLDDPAATAVETAVLAKAPEQSLATFTRAIRKAVAAAAPTPAEDEHAEAMSQRRVAHTPRTDAMSEIWMLLPATGAIAFMTAVNALACRCGPDDPRTADQRRADAAIQLAIDALSGTSCAELPREHRMRPTVQVCVALSTLLGLDEQPGDLDGSGPIPASVARRIAAQAQGDLLVLERVVNEQTGKLYTVIRVEDVRRSVSFFGSTAGEGGWRIAIVDAVDDLQREGANALLKVLEEMTFRRLGGTRDLSVNVRVVAATNGDRVRAPQGARRLLGGLRPDGSPLALEAHLQRYGQLPPVRRRPRVIARQARLHTRGSTRAARSEPVPEFRVDTPGCRGGSVCRSHHRRGSGGPVRDGL